MMVFITALTTPNS